MPTYEVSVGLTVVVNADDEDEALDEARGGPDNWDGWDVATVSDAEKISEDEDF